MACDIAWVFRCGSQSDPTVAGAFFASLAETLPGLTYHGVPIGNAGQITNWDTHLFSGAGVSELFVTSLLVATQRLDLDLLSLGAIGSTVEIQIIEVNGPGNDFQFDGIPYQNAPEYLDPTAALTYSPNGTWTLDAISAALNNLTLGAYQIAQISFETFDTVTNGTNLRDELLDEFSTDDSFSGLIRLSPPEF